MIKYLTFILLLFHLSASFAAAEEKYDIGLLCIGERDCRCTECEDVLSEAYSRIGASVNFVYLPWLRDLYAANNGETDGCGFRTIASLTEFPNLIAVQPPIITKNVIAFWRDPELDIHSLKDLSTMHVAVRRGEMFVVKTAMLSGRTIHMVDSYEQLFDMLKFKRVHAILIDAGSGKRLSKKLGETGLFQSGPLASTFAYHVLNKKFKKKLAGRLEKVFREMIKDGTMKRLAGQYSQMVVDDSPLDNLK